MKAANGVILEEDPLYEYEQEIRYFIGKGDINGAKDHFDAFDGDIEEKNELWSRFAANERSAMKERREVRPGRATRRIQSQIPGQDHLPGDEA